jgi:hypothetical protein
MILAGCPKKIEPSIIQSGEYYKVAITSSLHSGYNVNFNEENTPTVSIDYQIDEDTIRIAVFQLDGYDDKKKIGYKLITQDDKDQWEQDIEDGNADAPDLQYYEQIQTAVVEYDYPIILIDISEYQNGTDSNSLSENQDKFFRELYDNLFNTPAMKQWLMKNPKNPDVVK